MYSRLHSTLKYSYLWLAKSPLLLPGLVAPAGLRGHEEDFFKDGIEGSMVTPEATSPLPVVERELERRELEP